jgi:hypothetical protein
MKKILIICSLIFLSGCNSSQPIQPIDEDDWQTFDVYFYIPNDNGGNGELIWCGDSLSAMQNTVYTNIDPLQSAIQALLTVETDMVRAFWLDNALEKNNLTIDYIQDNNTYTIIALSGNITIQETCDIPRIEWQLIRTVWQFFPNNNFIILINELPLSEALQ